MSNINKGRPLPPVPPRPMSTILPSGVPPPIPPRRRDYENSEFVRRQTPTSGNQARANSVHNLTQQFQGLSCRRDGDTRKSYPNYLNSAGEALQHIYEEIPARSSTSGSYSAGTEEYWSDTTFETEGDGLVVRNESNEFLSDKSLSTERYSSPPENAADELLQNEQKYIDNLMNGILNFIPLIYHMNLPEGLRGQRNNLFGNVEEIHELHQDDFLPALRRCYQNVEKIAQCFIHYVETDKFYCYVKYALNRRKSDTIFERHRDYFSSNQHELNSFLLQPIQRLPRYLLFMDKFTKETLKFGDDHYTASHISTIKKAQEKLSDLVDLMNAAVSISDIPQCAIEFAVTSSFSQAISGFGHDNDLPSTLILKPKGNKLQSRNNPIDLFAQGKLIRVLDTEIYDEARYRAYKSKFFIFEKLLIYTEITKAGLPYRGHYFGSEINYWEDSRKLHLFCLHRGTQEIQMRCNKTLADTVKTIRQRAISQFFSEPQLIDFEAPLDSQTTRAFAKTDLDLANSIMALINSQIQYVQVFQANFEYYLECQTHLQETQLHKFKEICLKMNRLHYDQIISDLSANVGNIAGICTMFSQYVQYDFPPLYGEYLKVGYSAVKFIRHRPTSNTSCTFLVPTIDDFVYLCIGRLEEFTQFFSTLTEKLSEQIIQNTSSDRSTYHQLAVVQVELDKFTRSVGDNYRLLSLNDEMLGCGLAVSSERAKIRTEQLEAIHCRIFICERAVVCVACSVEQQFTKRRERFDKVIFIDRFSSRAHPMRLRKSRKDDDVGCFTFGSTKYKIKFQTSQARDRFCANYVQQFVSFDK
ncbi:hypothetical protein RP20_CCG018380 [Aedes albopictus]|nr:hypothetical protein RP20_CCG018380 [Aedes albopictus]